MPPYLVAFASDRGEAGRAWLARLPGLVESYAERWSLELDEPLGDPPRAAGWVAMARRRTDGADVVLKVGWPHPEAETEAAGLRHFAGRGAVRLLESDDREFALLLERARPGDDLRSLPVEEGDARAAEVLRTLWRAPSPAAAPIGTLAATVAGWEPLLGEEAERAATLLATAPEPVVLHGDFNPTNVLRRGVDDWVAIDPKPLVGDPAYDLAQYLANHVDLGREALRRQTLRFASALDLDAARIAGWAAVKAHGWSWGPRTAAWFAGLADGC